MKIIGLVENTTIDDNLFTRHGLSLYIETGDHKILFDLGPDDSILSNAKKLGVDLAAVDTVVISHGHHDHGGGLAAFLSVNHTAKIYMKELAFEPHFSDVPTLPEPHFIGLDQALMQNPQIVFTPETMQIDENLFLFSNVTARKLYSQANRALCIMVDGKLTPDPFQHEQFLVITEGDKQVMITGCSHNGIVNIMDKYQEKYNTCGKPLTCVIGGFHMFNPNTKKYESDELIGQVAAHLKTQETAFYTCHCTGVMAYDKMKEVMADQLGYMATGVVVEL